MCPNSYYRTRYHRVRGFSLLEMMVAMAILGMSLLALYQAVAGASQATRIDEKYLYAVELARSLLADHPQAPANALSGSTEGGFDWQVSSQPAPAITALGEQPAPLATTDKQVLQQIEVQVGWQDGERQRQVRLVSVVPGAAP